MNGDWTDIPRIIALVLGSGACAVTLVVVWQYQSIYRVHRRLAKADVVPDWRGLLPRHVVGVGISHIGLIVVGMVFLADRLNASELSWVPILLGLFNGLGLWALWDVLGSTRHRKHEFDLRVKDLPKAPPRKG